MVGIYIRPTQMNKLLKQKLLNEQQKVIFLMIHQNLTLNHQQNSLIIRNLKLLQVHRKDRRIKNYENN